MFKNSSNMLFLIILMMGTMITVSANSWISAWMGLEINLLAFIPLMVNTNNLMSTEASLKYFLVQALASSILLFMIIMYMMKFNFIYQLSMNSIYLNYMIISSLLLKMGAAPFHFWFPSTMEGLSWNNSLVLMTWQKIAPMMLLSYLTLNNMVYFTIILSVIVGALGGLNQTSLRKIMAFSSINHLGWMISSMMFSESLWFFYFFMYCLLSVNVILFFNIYKLYHMNQLFNIFFNSKLIKFCLFMNLLSLGGLPPFLGFIPKWIIIQNLVLNNQSMLMMIMVMASLITLYFYLRMSFSAFMLNYYENNWVMNNNFDSINMHIYLIMSFFSLFGMMLINSIYFIL
uniref:NADH-ubiquinone oxidoreductase chain 2 n=1 Tax=Rhagio sp. KW-2016 TaxID=1812710 RepID=A0A164R2J6_9DIPT|nr:NADH dehydrogenase subunit 2 [Rhagio sp. KW-2016]